MGENRGDMRSCLNKQIVFVQQERDEQLNIVRRFRTRMKSF